MMYRWIIAAFCSIYLGMAFGQTFPGAVVDARSPDFCEAATGRRTAECQVVGTLTPAALVGSDHLVLARGELVAIPKERAITYPASGVELRWPAYLGGLVAFVLLAWSAYRSTQTKRKPAI